MAFQFEDLQTEPVEIIIPGVEKETTQKVKPSTKAKTKSPKKDK